MKNSGQVDAKRFVYLATAVSALGRMLFGYDTGIISGAILFIKKDFALSAGQEELGVSSVLAGCLLGALAGGTLADRYGRRKLLMITAVVFAVEAVGAAIAPGVAVAGCRQSCGRSRHRHRVVRGTPLYLRDCPSEDSWNRSADRQES